LNIAPTDSLPAGVTWQLGVVPLQAPDQPANVLFALALAESVTGTPIAIGSLQDAVQLAPSVPHDSETVPCPVPEIAIVSRGSKANCAPAVVAPVNVKVQVEPVNSLHAPPQDTKCASLAALAIKVSGVSGWK
jgi:hypothetical protein